MKNTSDIWLMPDYYPDFQCKADKCRHTCCYGWQIPVSFKEYNSLIGMECSKDLHEKIQVAFAQPKMVTEEAYRCISFDWQGHCKLLKNGLCSLYSEKGPQALPKICNFFPRSLKQINEQKLACCSSSCERVVEMLYERDFLHMIRGELKDDPNIHVSISEDDVKKIIHYQDVLKDRSTSLVESLQTICLEVNEAAFSRDYEEETDPVILALDLLDRLSEEQSFLNEIYEEVNERYRHDARLYEADRKTFEEEYPNWQVFFENILNNSLLFENFPFVDSRFDDTDAYKGLCASYGLLRILAVGYTRRHNDQQSLIDAVAALFHLIDHSPFYYNAHVLVRNGAAFLKL